MKLNELWQKFLDNHAILQGIEDEESMNAYYVNNYKQQVHAVVEKMTSDIQEKLKSSEEAAGMDNAAGPTISSMELSSEEQKIRTKKQTIKMTLLKKYIQREQEVLKIELKSDNYYQFKLSEVIEMWKNITQLHEEILVYATDDDFKNEYFTGEGYEHLENIYREFITELHSSTNKKKNDSVSDSAEIQDNHEIKLPPIAVPTFDGNYKNWVTFQEIYEKIIHKNKRLEKVEKMHYLKTSVKGEAHKLIQHLTTSETNYDAAWDLLNNRFNNQRIIFSAHLDAILNQPTILNESAYMLKQLHDTTQEHLHAIKNLKVDTKSWGSLLAHIIIKKVDTETHKLYEQTLKDPREIPQLNDVLTFLENRFQSLEALGENKKRTQQKERTTYNRPNENGKWMIKNHCTTIKNCKYCKGSHTIYTCAGFREKSVPERLTFVKQNKICQNCLNHEASEKCYSTSKCVICKRQHHSLLHLRTTGNVQNNVQN